MDRRQGPARLLGLALLLLLGAADTPQLPIREARWLKTPDLVVDLTTQPTECLALPKEAAQRQSVEVGRALFHSPLLLGGQAARVGLSCSSCHRNGRSNPHFHFPGISGEPGTADVTASIMSSHRGDDIFNPKPIPDLTGDPAKLKISRDPAKDDLSKFIQGLITQEFDGAEPSPPALASIANYVRALKQAACPKNMSEPINLGARLHDVDSAVALAREFYRSGDAATGRDLLSAARSTLGAIEERFQLAGLDESRAELASASTTLFQLQETQSATAWRRWRNDWPQRKQRLLAAEPRSLFNPAVLRKMT